MVFAVMFTGQLMYNAHQEENKEDFDIYNFTENNLVWNYSIMETDINKTIIITKLSYGKIQTNRIQNSWKY